jgi:hypothetical protein
MKPLNAAPQPVNAASPEARDASHPEWLAWLAAMTPGRTANEEAQWRLMEAERLDDQTLETLSLELSGY